MRTCFAYKVTSNVMRLYTRKLGHKARIDVHVQWEVWQDICFFRISMLRRLTVFKKLSQLTCFTLKNNLRVDVPIWNLSSGRKLYLFSAQVSVLMRKIRRHGEILLIATMHKEKWMRRLHALNRHLGSIEEVGGCGIIVSGFHSLANSFIKLSALSMNLLE